MASLFTRPVSLPLSASVFLSSYSSAPLSVSTFFCLKRHVMSETKRAAFLSGYSSIPGISATATCLSVSHRVTIQKPICQLELSWKVLGPQWSGKRFEPKSCSKRRGRCTMPDVSGLLLSLSQPLDVECVFVRVDVRASLVRCVVRICVSRSCLTLLIWTVSFCDVCFPDGMLWCCGV